MKNNELATILLAEDDDGHARLLQWGLEHAGVRNPLIRFRDGTGIWDFITGKSRPGLDPARRYLLLLDIRMPEMDGIEVLRRVRSDRRFSGLPVMMLTTSDDPKEIRRCHELGCNNFSVKPVDVLEIARLFDLPRFPGKNPAAGRPA